MNYNPGSIDITVWEALELGIIPTIIALVLCVVVPLLIVYLLKRKKKYKEPIKENLNKKVDYEIINRKKNMYCINLKKLSRTMDLLLQ